MGKNFYYTRRVSINDPNGGTTEGGQPLQKIIEVKDFFNIDYAIRGHWISETSFVVLLNDGHEESKDSFDTKGRQIKRRDWYVSQIELFGDDIERFKKLTELL